MYSSPNGKEKPEVYPQEHLLQGGFLIDMDGVIYHNSRLIPGADRFVSSLIQNEVPFLFCTNNSQRTRRDLVMKLKQLGIDVKERNIFTSAMATARFLAAQNPQGTAYVTLRSHLKCGGFFGHPCVDAFAGPCGVATTSEA